MSGRLSPPKGPLNWFRLELPARPENVALVRVAVGSLASHLDFTLGEIEEIRVAVSEAFSNVVLHAYPEEGGAASGGTVTVEARAGGGVLEVSVSDRGVGIADVELARRPSYTTRPDRMGLGFVFMETFMDEVAVTTSPGHGTRVVLRRRLPVRNGAPSDGASGDERAGT